MPLQNKGKQKQSIKVLSLNTTWTTEIHADEPNATCSVDRTPIFGQATDTLVQINANK